MICMAWFSGGTIFKRFVWTWFQKRFFSFLFPRAGGTTLSRSTALPLGAKNMFPAVESCLVSHIMWAIFISGLVDLVWFVAQYSQYSWFLTCILFLVSGSSDSLSFQVSPPSPGDVHAALQRVIKQFYGEITPRWPSWGISTAQATNGIWYLGVEGKMDAILDWLWLAV